MLGSRKTKKPELSHKNRVSRLREWLPRRMARQSALNRHFFLVIVAFLFAIMFSVAGMTNLVDENVRAFAWLLEIGVVFSSIFLGFCLNNWWTAWDKGDEARIAAEKIDDKLEEEIQWISENLKQIANSVSLLKEPHEAFFEATRFMLTAQLTAVGGRIERMALEIDRLGYNSGEFLEEKRQRFKEIHSRVRELMNLVPKESGLQDIDKAVSGLIYGLGRTPPLLEPDHTEREEGNLDVVPGKGEEGKQN
ncbi:MAG: hypothetical protein OXQ29_02110 [Rhodospirillaceae bacterium]|nr:hypothetical protein [Rhodospirillaceae bacterium]